MEDVKDEPDDIQEKWVEQSLFYNEFFGKILEIGITNRYTLF